MSQLLSNLSQLTADAINEFQKAAKTPVTDELKKAGITVASNFTAYDLQAPAKNLFPVLTPIRNSTPRVSGGGGTATNWKRVTAINSAFLRGFVPEGKRNGVVTTAAEPMSASYKALGLEDSISYEAEMAAKGFEDIRSTQAQRLLWATMIEEEIADIGANLSVTLGTPTAPTVVVTDSDGGTIAAAAGGYACRVVALTLHGYLASSVASGVVAQVSVTNAAGNTFTYGGGSSMKSNSTVSGATSGGASTLKLSTPVVAGAVAYAWYVGPAAGDVTLQAITNINSVKLSALTTDKQNVTAITADYGKNTLGYDGLLYHAWGSGSGAYIKNMATGTAGTGTGLTAVADGSIQEINDMFRSMWDNYRLSPSKIYVNAQEADNITKKVLTATNAQINFVSGTEFGGGNRIKSLLNRFAMGAAPEVPIQIHPYLPAGTILAVTETLPYPINGVPNVYEMRLRRDYYQMEWPMTERQYESGVYMDGVLAHYFTPSLGIITNIANA